MPFQSATHTSNTTFIGHSTTIVDDNKLVEWVALTLMAKHNHILKIIALSAAEDQVPAKETVVRSIVKNILHASNVYHRDGLLFQHISWVFSAMKKSKHDILKAPHCRIADKGQDTIIINFQEGNDVVGISICEDKATEAPRKTIKGEVYPEFKDYELGNRDSELESEVLAMLEKQFDAEQANSIIKSIFWHEIKQYRINITINNENPLKIFKDYDHCIPGDPERRTGNTFQISNLRDWLAQFSQKLEKHLNSLIEA